MFTNCHSETKKHVYASSTNTESLPSCCYNTNKCTQTTPSLFSPCKMEEKEKIIQENNQPEKKICLTKEKPEEIEKETFKENDNDLGKKKTYEYTGWYNYRRYDITPASSDSVLARADVDTPHPKVKTFNKKLITVEVTGRYFMT